jgi:hypothetical protein
MSRLRTALLVLALAGCTNQTVVGPSPAPDAPTFLTYRLVPSGDPAAPQGIVLQWEPPTRREAAYYVVYSRAASGARWLRRAETSSTSFHDVGIPHLQYYVTAVGHDGAEGAPSAAVTVDQRNRLNTPSSLWSISLNRAVQLSWSSNARQSDPQGFDYYRVYSALYDLDAGRCIATSWVLEGSTVSEDFLATGLPNGVPRCFAISAISRDGHESLWTTARADTPRPDARNVIVWAREHSVSGSGFRFEPASGGLGAVLSGDRNDLDFRVERRSGGVLWLVPVRSGTRVALYSTQPISDLTSIDLAPVGGYSTGAIEAVPGYGYVFETVRNGHLHFGGVRVTHVSQDYLIFDWSYQTDPGNPELRIGDGSGDLTVPVSR